MAREDDNGTDAGANGGGERRAEWLSALKTKELVLPAVLAAAGAVAAAKGPGLVRKLSEATEEKGEQEAQELGEKAAQGAKKGIASGSGGLAGKALSKALGQGRGGGAGGKKTRRLPIQRWTDVAVPVEKAYEAWTKFGDYPKFMHRVLSVEQKGKDKVNWQEKIWFSKRQWEGRITDQRENDRIAWKTTSGMSHYGVVSFHPISDNLTRVMVTMEFEPNGMIEKMASGLRFVKRAVQADLARFKAYVEMDDAKGVQYRSVREENDDERQQNGDREEHPRDEQAAPGDEPQDEEHASEDNHEAERQDRETRRQERREGAKTS